MARIEDLKLPHRDNIEDILIGELMTEPEHLSEIAEIVKPEMFFKSENKKIFESIMEMYLNNENIDIYTVSSNLEKKNVLEYVGGAYGVAKLVENVGSCNSIEYHAKIIAQTHIRRELIKLTSASNDDAYNEAIDIADVINDLERKIANITDLTSGTKRNAVKLIEIVPSVIKQIEESQLRGDGISGVETGFSSIDKVTHGWHNSDMIIIGGRPAMGKTALVVSFAENMAKLGKKVLMCSLEMSKEQLCMRLMSMNSGINHEDLISGNMTIEKWRTLEDAIAKFKDIGIYIDDESGINEISFKNKVKRYKKEHNIDIVIVDYLQLMNSSKDFGSKTNNVGHVSTSIKTIAKEFNVPIIVLSQLSREAAKRQGGDMKPTLTDLRDSGNIEQDADVVGFIHRPQYYGIPITEDGEPTEGLGQFLIEKNRHGRCEIVNLKWEPERVRFTEWY